MRRSMKRLATMVLALVGACRAEKQPPQASPPAADQPEPRRPPLAERRERMVEDTIVRRGVTDARVLAAMRKVPRHELVPDEVRARAYDDRPLSIGYDVTIS